MRKINIISIIFIITILYSCDSGISKAEYDKVLKENTDLKAEIEELKFGPDKLLTEAKNFYDSKSYESSIGSLSKLIEKHPASNEAREAKELLAKSKKEISKIKALKEQEAKKVEEENKRRLAKATSKMRTNVDEMKGITWYYDKNTSKYNNVNSLHLYMGKEKDSKPWLRFRIQYKGDDWLFIENYTIKTDNETYTFTPFKNVERDNGSGGIWEWCDEKVTKRTYDIVQDIIDSKSVKIRHNGSKYYKDRTISSREKTALKNVLDAYEALGGNLNF